MPRPRKITPSYLKHRQSGQGRLVWSDASGARREKLLPGPFESPESLAAKARLELELATSPTQCVPTGMTISDLILAYHHFAVGYYRDADGNPTKELRVIRYALRPLRALYGQTPAAEFGPLKLKAVREQMIADGLSRGLINRRVSVIKRVIRCLGTVFNLPMSYVTLVEDLLMVAMAAVMLAAMAGTSPVAGH